MIHRINRKKYQIYAFDIESHNDEETIAKRETSMWLGCLIDETSKVDYEDIYFYDMDSVIDRLEYLSSRKRNKIKGINEKRPCNNICIYIYNLSFEWSFILPVLLKRGFKYKEIIDKEDEYCFNSISTKSVSSVWMINLKFGKNSGSVLFRDLAKIYGGGLGLVAKAFNLETQKGEIDYRLNRLHGHVVTQEEKEYCFKDVRIIVDILLRMIENNDSAFWNSCSMASMSMRRLLRSSYPRALKPYKEFRKTYPELEQEETDFLRHSVGGGLTYCTPSWQFKEIEHDILHIDAHQMHPTQMWSKPFPYGYGEYFKGKPTKFFKMINCCHVLISYDEAILHSQIPLLNNNAMVVDAELYLWDFEIPIMKKIYRNLQIKYIDGYCYHSRFLPCRKYIEQNYNKRLEARKKKDAFGTLYYKLLNNSSYGKFLEKPHNDYFENCLDNFGIINSRVYGKEEYKVNAKYTYIPVGSCIPAYSRVALIETALKFCKIGEDGYPIVDNLIYFDTDSIFLIYDHHAEEVWKTIPQEDYLGNWGLEEICDRAMFTAPKRYKTETDGKATIKAGGINFHQFKADKVDEMIGDDIDEETRKEMIENYQIPYTEVNIISSKWSVQRAYRVKGGTIIEFQEKEMKVAPKYMDIFNKNAKM